MSRFAQAEAQGELDFYGVNAQQAMYRAINEAQDLQAEILHCFEHQENPDVIFDAFHDSEVGADPYLFQLRKAKPDERDPFIRIYAVRLDDAYVIISGDVKTTKDTKGRKQTNVAAQKAKTYRNAIHSLDIRNAAKMNQHIERQPE